MKRLQKNGHIILFNFIILMIFAPLFLHVLNADNIASSSFIGSPKFRDMGRWSIRLLVISLSISPLVYIFNWRKLVPLRKWAGLWAFAFAGLHLLLFFQDYTWGKAWGTDFARVGLAGFIILAILAATSHRWAMRLLGRNWKRLHRLVYVAGILVVLHSINGFLTWKGQYTASHPPDGTPALWCVDRRIAGIADRSVAPICEENAGYAQTKTQTKNGRNAPTRIRLLSGVVVVGNLRGRLASFRRIRQ